MVAYVCGSAHMCASFCLPHPPIPSSPTVSPNSVNDNSILPRNAFVPLLLSLYLTLVSAVWSASMSPSRRMDFLRDKVVGPHAAHASGYMF